MKRWLGWLAIGWLLVLSTVALVAYGTPAHAGSLEERTHALAAQLKCPVCQGESVADSQSDIAVAIRAEIHRDLRSGEGPDQIRAFLLSRYPSISLAPSASGVGRFAWLAPPFLLLGGTALLLTLIVDWRQRGRNPTMAINTVYLERVRAELAADEA